MQDHRPTRRRFLVAAGVAAASAAALPAAASAAAASATASSTASAAASAAASATASAAASSTASAAAASAAAAAPHGSVAAGSPAPAPVAPPAPAPEAEAPLSSARAGAMPLQHIDVGALDVAYYSGGPEAGRPVVLLHDHFDSIDSLAELAGLLAVQGMRVLLPQLRGHGETAFKDPAAPRAALPGALGKDAIGLIDALHMPEAVFAGIGWGATAARAAAVFKPTRCIGLVLAREGPATAATAATADRATGAALAHAASPVPATALAPSARTVPAIELASAEPRAMADAIAALVRQGKWRT